MDIVKRQLAEAGRRVDPERVGTGLRRRDHGGVSGSAHSTSILGDHPIASPRSGGWLGSSERPWSVLNRRLAVRPRQSLGARQHVDSPAHRQKTATIWMRTAAAIGT
jgi:hypothetical protein